MREQFFATIVANFLTILYGISVGWAAPTLLLFQSQQSPIGIVTPQQNSLIVSLLCIGATAGTILFGVGSDYLGRKLMLILMAIPQLIANVLLLVGTNYLYIYAARFLFGLAGGGCFIVVPMFVSEITHERVRGTLGSFLAISFNLGIVIGYVLASLISYRYAPYIPIAFTFVFLGIFVWLPESPDYLAHKQRLEESRKAYDFYGNTRSTTDDVALPETGTVTEMVPTIPTKITLEDFKDKAVIKGILISFALIIFADTSGILVLTSFITELFDWASIKLDVYLATITVGVIQVLGAIISSIFVDRFGRRLLLILSCIGTAICLFALGFYFHILHKPEYNNLVDNLQWLPVVSVCAAVLVAAAGVVTLPFFVIAELLPVKLKSVITSVSLSASWLFAFLMIEMYHRMVDSLTIAGTVWLYASTCVVEIFFVYFCLPETKNLSIEQIQEKLRKGVK